MALSEYEQKMLEELEAQLKDEDPKLAESFRPAVQVGLKNLIIGVLLVVAGLGIVIGAISMGWSWLGIIGFGVMLGGAIVMTNGKPAEKVSAAPRQNAPRRSTSFMDRQNEKWDRRRDNM